MQIRAGSNTAGRGGQVVQVFAIHSHPSYSPRTTDYDVSVLRLSGAISLGYSAAPIELTTSSPSAGTNALTSGWGTTSEGGSPSSQLRAVTVPIVSYEECDNAYGFNAITDRMICAGFPNGGKDACQVKLLSYFVFIIYSWYMEKESFFILIVSAIESIED